MIIQTVTPSNFNRIRDYRKQNQQQCVTNQSFGSMGKSIATAPLMGLTGLAAVAMVAIGGLNACDSSASTGPAETPTVADTGKVTNPETPVAKKSVDGTVINMVKNIFLPGGAATRTMASESADSVERFGQMNYTEDEYNFELTRNDAQSNDSLLVLNDKSTNTATGKLLYSTWTVKDNGNFVTAKNSLQGYTHEFYLEGGNKLHEYTVANGVRNDWGTLSLDKNGKPMRVWADGTDTTYLENFRFITQ